MPLVDNKIIIKKILIRKGKFNLFIDIIPEVISKKEKEIWISLLSINKIGSFRKLINKSIMKILYNIWKELVNSFKKSNLFLYVKLEIGFFLFVIRII